MASPMKVKFMPMAEPSLEMRRLPLWGAQRTCGADEDWRVDPDVCALEGNGSYLPVLHDMKCFPSQIIRKKEGHLLLTASRAENNKNDVETICDGISPRQPH